MNSSIFNSNSYLRYLIKIAIGVTTLLLCIGVFNWLVNPLLLFSSPNIDGFNTYKTQFFANQHTVKPHWARAALADTVILGSSRAGNGLDPTHPGFEQASTFNYAIPGARINTIARIYSEASELVHLEKVVLTLDFFSFNIMPSLVEIRDVDMLNRFVSHADGRKNWKASWIQIEDRIMGLFSWQSTRASVATVLAQSAISDGSDGYIEYFRNGHWRQSLPTKRNQIQHIRTIERQYMGSSWFPEPSKQFNFSDGDRSSFESYSELLRSMYMDKVEAILLISPLHARFQSALELVDLQDKFELWKRQLLTIDVRVAKELNQSLFPIWDFAEFGPLNEEAIPDAANIDGRMWSYLDGQHYTVELGNYLLDRILGYQHPDRSEANEFGTLLTTANIDFHLRQVNLRQQTYANNHADDMLDLQKSFTSVRQADPVRGNSQ